MKLYPEEYKEKQNIARKLFRYYSYQARKNGLSDLGRIMDYLPEEFMFRAMRRDLLLLIWRSSQS